MTPEWLNVTALVAISSVSDTNFFTSPTGIDEEPRRALMSPGEDRLAELLSALQRCAGRKDQDRRRLRRFEFRPHITAEVTVGCLPFALGVAVDQAVQLALQIRGATSSEFHQERPVNSPGLVQGNGKRPGGALDMLRRSVLLKGTPLEDGGLSRLLRIGVIVFERQKERPIGVGCEGPAVLPVGEGTKSCDKGIVDAVEEFSCPGNAFFLKMNSTTRSALRQVTSLQLGEPPADLFKVPSDYTLADEVSPYVVP